MIDQQTDRYGYTQMDTKVGIQQIQKDRENFELKIQRMLIF